MSLALKVLMLLRARRLQSVVDQPDHVLHSVEDTSRCLLMLVGTAGIWI